jgi:hypothetical protein
MESDRDKFVRLANNRVTKAINAIRIIGNLSNRSNYSYTEADVEKIFKALNSELKSCRQKFSPDTAGADRGFKLE